MSDPKTGFALGLILAEERGEDGPGRERAPGAQAGRLVRENVIMEREDYTTAEAFHIHQPGRSMPIEGPGTLIDALVIADKNDFGCYAEVDGQTIVNQPFTQLEKRSAELSRVSAYTQQDGDSVFSVNDYEFQQAIDVVIQPTEEVRFSVIRAEADLIRGKGHA